MDELARELGLSDIVKLASNENPRGPGERVRAAIRGALDDLSRYPDGNGFRLKSVLAEIHGVDLAQITLGNGSNDVLDLAARVSLEPGLEAITSEHAFVVYRLATISCNANLTTVPAVDFGADLQAILAAVTPATRIVFLANPNNPTGTWVTNNALCEFLDALPPRVWVVLDEAYAEFVEEPDYPNGVALLDRYPNVCVTRTFSKIHGLAAERIGWATGAPDLIDVLNRIRGPFNVTVSGQKAALAALGDTAFVEHSRAHNTATRARFVEAMAALGNHGISTVPSEANFVLVRFEGEVKAEAALHALAEAGYAVRHLPGQGPGDALRITIGTSEDMAKVIATLRALCGEAA